MNYKTLGDISKEHDLQYHTLYSRVLRIEGIRTQRVGNMILVHEGDIDKLTFEPQAHSPRTHGLSGTKIYSRWTSLLHYHRENVCEAWHQFERFLEDMGEPENQSYKLVRMDPDKPWGPDNCKWQQR